MTTIESALAELGDLMELGRYGIDRDVSCLLVTPRFRASRHIVGLVAPSGTGRPALVVKIPRLATDRSGVEREARNLRMIQGSRPKGYATIPRLVGLGEYAGRPVLVETALLGRPMGPGFVRRRPGRCIEAVIEWLESLPRGKGRNVSAPGWQERLVEQPLRRFAAEFPSGAPEQELVRETLDLLGSYPDTDPGRVFEHGDLSHPNLLWLERGRVGVLDWELADPDGLPLADLCFFLTYVAFARRKAQSLEQQVAAFEEAFLDRRAWARPTVARHASAMGVTSGLVTPLFVGAFARYTARLLGRLGGDLPAAAAGHSSSERGPLDPPVWIRRNRYYALWARALTSADRLEWSG